MLYSKLFSTGRLALGAIHLKQSEWDTLVNSINAVAQTIGAANTRKSDKEWTAEQNEITRNYNAEQAEIARNWSAEQAQNNRDFQSWQGQVNFERQSYLQNAQNTFNYGMWNENNAYNSIGSQIQRAKEAGVNPNLYISGSSNVASQPVQASQQTAQSTPSGSQGDSPAASSSAINANYSQNPWNFLDMAKTAKEIESMDIDNKKKSAETEAQLTENKFIERARELGIKATESQISKMYAETEHTWQSIENMRQEVKESCAKVNVLEEEAKQKGIENAYKEKEIQSLIDKYCSESKLSKAQAHAILSKLPAEISVLHSDAEYKKAYASLARHEQEEVDQIVQGLNIDNDTKYVDYSLKTIYGPAMMAEELSRAKFGNWWLTRTLDNTAKILGPISTVGGAAILGTKVQLKPNKVKGFSQ